MSYKSKIQAKGLGGAEEKDLSKEERKERLPCGS